MGQVAVDLKTRWNLYTFLLLAFVNTVFFFFPIVAIPLKMHIHIIYAALLADNHLADNHLAEITLLIITLSESCCSTHSPPLPHRHPHHNHPTFLPLLVPFEAHPN